MFLCCWRICVVCLALEFVGPWVVLGFSVGMETLMSFYRLMFPGLRSPLVFSVFGLKPPASGFQSCSYSSLKMSPSVIFKVVPSVLTFSVCWSPVSTGQSAPTSKEQETLLTSLPFPLSFLPLTLPILSHFSSPRSWTQESGRRALSLS